MPFVTLAGEVDRELASRADALLRLLTLEHHGAVAIDVSLVEAVNGALLGVFLRASRRLAWQNRRVIILCSEPKTRRRLETAGLDQLATLTGALRPLTKSD